MGNFIAQVMTAFLLAASLAGFCGLVVLTAYAVLERLQ